jgi:hypothetical protein
MVDNILRTKVTGRKVVPDDIFKGVSPVKLPNPNKEAEMERHFAKEDNANWKIVCLGNQFEKCHQIRYLQSMDIAQVDEAVKYWHPKHKKALYQKETMGQQSYRGTLPNVEEADEASRTGGKRG